MSGRGLTGGSGMGKSTAAGMLRGLRVPVHDSDSAVHAVTAPGGAAVPGIRSLFPEVVVDGAVDRRRLGDRVFGDDAALKNLEEVVHPLVRKVRDRFLAACARRREAVAVLDVPLLFEIGLDGRCDAIVVVSAPGFLQSARVLSRPGMTREKFEGILERQLPDAEKRMRADFVVPTGNGRRRTLRELRAIVKLMRSGGRPREGRSCARLSLTPRPRA